MNDRMLLRILLPLAIACVVLGAWEAAVRLEDVPVYLLPAPSRIAQALWTDWPVLGPSLAFTLKITLLSLAVAVIGGVLLSVLLTQSQAIEYSLLPYAIVLQVTPIVAIAPLIIIWIDDTTLALLVCAWIVAFFPILSNTTLGLKSTDRNLVDLFRLYRAGRWQTLMHLRIPGALPYFLGGLKISGGLALIGAVVAEFAAGAGGKESGLAWRILEASYRLNVPRMFAALVLISGTGIAIFGLLSLLSHLLLRRWHESELDGQG